MNLSIIIPVFNEENSIEILANEIKSVLMSRNYSYEIIFIDDGSTDNSLREIQKLSKDYKSVKYLSFKFSLFNFFFNPFYSFLYTFFKGNFWTII